MLELFRKFWTFAEPNVIWVVLGSCLLGASAGVIGCYGFLRKRSLTGDALAHAALPGVTSAFILSHSRDPGVILAGSILSCLLGYLVIEVLINYTKVKEDSAFAIVLSFFFAVGIFQLTYIQKLNVAGQAGLDKILFGQAASLVRSDVELLGGIALGLLIFVLTLFQRLKLVVFDREFARTLGVKVELYEGMLALAIVLSTVIGLQLVGVVLMAALLLTPAAAARYWSERLGVMILLAGFFGALSGLVGANISYLAPRMPTGPWMVVSISLIFIVSVAAAPERGLIARYSRRRRFSLRIVEENLLRTLFKIGEALGEEMVWVEPGTILTYRNMALRDLDSALARLVSKDLLEWRDNRYRLTDEGVAKARKITRFHRLWELYLKERIRIAEDHVHADAEEIEHILTPELESRLRAELNSPDLDPHGRAIPRPSVDNGPSADKAGKEGE